MSSQSTVIFAMEYIKDTHITLFVLNNEGWKFFITIYVDDLSFGRTKDLYMCTKIPKITWEQYKELPDKITKESLYYQ